ncbi:hypothetical protein Halru_1441 [Halovivax ruber XH-70]|uniref:Archaeal Type IV pilin N-terminal domain-containing protein n=1 Tax=Halovivax ruber (strain DSM 18193 / JCM 13892 / XH-70) TaxID=797302 RepID=L0ICU6_HALRX|nr:hypothetical protein [Halovivax ruber]AGB16051.1 hypothetical protein Halru_1441 [Halovivax ruber XH-70]
MASRAAKMRAALTAIGVVLGITVLLVVVFFILAMGVNLVGSVFVGGGDGGTTEAPDIEFETTLENESVVVRHAGGPTVNASTITFELNGDGRGTWKAQSQGEADQVSEGDTVRLDGVSTGDELAIRWTDGDSAELLSFETLEADST